MNHILKHYWPEVKKYKLRLLFALVGISIIVLLQLWVPYLLRDFTNILSTQATPDGINSALYILYTIAGIYFSVWLLWRFNDFMIIAFETQAMRDMENRAFSCLHNQSLRFFKENFTGSLVKKVNRFTYSFEDLTDIFLFNFYPQFLKVGIIFVIFTIEQPLFGMLFLIWAIIYLGGSYLFARWKLKYDLVTAQADSEVSGALADSLSNYSSVKTFAKKDFEKYRFAGITQNRYIKRRFSWSLNVYANYVKGFVVVALDLLILYHIIKFWQVGSFGVGDFVFFQAYLLVLFQSLWDFSRQIERTFERIADAKEMVKIFDFASDIQEINNAKELCLNKGDIAIKNMNFIFEKDGKQLFKNFNLHIPAGQKVALVGPSGSGKTTLVSLLFRFYNINSGQILIDNQDVSEVTLKSLRSNISMVPQNPELFHRTLAENIAYGQPDSTFEDITQAAHKAHAAEFIDTLPKKYETMVGERGVKLSGGEKQRIAIARAFIENAPILILDEATSALDSVTEKKIQDAIFTLMKNRTSIVIAHRLSTILHMDRIIVMKHGQIVEDGTHEELLNLKGVYAELWEHQAGGFIEG